MFLDLIHNKLTPPKIIFLLALIISLISTFYFYTHGNIISYGDSESHLNIAKRVISSPTAGFAQLGGIWLPLPHLLMVPFVSIDFLWRTGLAGSIVSGIFFIISSIYIYKLIYILTKNSLAGFIGFIAFAINTNILYMQSTPMTELPLIGFFIISTYYFVKFLQNTDEDLPLVLAAFFGFCASLTRYDGWFLVGIQWLILFYFYVRTKFSKGFEGKLVLFSTLALLGILIWLVWDMLILGDAFYFTNSPFSAKSQQQGWLSRGELPTYRNIIESTAYYLVTVFYNVGPIVLIGAGLALILFIFDRKILNKIFILLLLIVPVIFYILTLFIGQSVIFIPPLTPSNYEWNLFNVRYGITIIPSLAVLLGYLFSQRFKVLKFFVLFLLLTSSLIFFSGKFRTITWDDGVFGLSSSRPVDAEQYLKSHYNGGYVLLDDYARSVSILRSNLDMQNVIYIGNKPYWDESLKEPEKYASWIVIQQNDQLWKSIYEVPEVNGRLYKYFTKVYSSKEVLVFKRNTTKLSTISF